MTNVREAALSLWLRRMQRRSRLSDADCRAVLDFPGEQVEFGSGRDIVKLEQRTTHSCLVADGTAWRFGQTGQGDRQLTALYIPGDMADLHSAVLPRVSAPLQAGSYATIIRIPHDTILAVAAQSPALGRAFWRDCVVDAQVASEWTLNIGRRDALARVAHVLCEMACRYDAIGALRPSFPLDFTQIHLGDAVGLTAVHVNRMLRSLREAGAIDIAKNVATVLDWQKLTYIGDFDPSYLHLETQDED